MTKEQEKEELEWLKKFGRCLKYLYEEETYTDEDSIEYQRELKERNREYWNSQF